MKEPKKKKRKKKEEKKERKKDRKKERKNERQRARYRQTVNKGDPLFVWVVMFFSPFKEEHGKTNAEDKIERESARLAMNNGFI